MVPSAASASPTLSLVIRAPEALEVIAALRLGIRELKTEVAGLGSGFTSGATSGVARLESQVNELSAALATSRLELLQMQQKLEATSAVGIRAVQAEQQAIVTKNRVAREEAKQTALAEEEARLRGLSAAETAFAKLQRLPITSIEPNTKQRLTGESLSGLENEIGVNRAAAKQREIQQARDTELYRTSQAEQLRIHAEALTENLAIDSAAAKRREIQQARDTEIYRTSQAEQLRVHAEALTDNAAIDRAASKQREIQQVRDTELYRASQAEQLRVHAEAITDNAAMDRAAAKQREIQQARDTELYRTSQAEQLRIHAEAAAQNAAIDKARALDAEFNAASAARKLSLAQRAAAYNSAGLDGAAQFGSAAASADISALAALAAANKNAGSAASEHAEKALKLRDAQREAHSAARGLAGGLNALWLSYGSVIPLVAGFAIAASLRESVKAGSEFQYQMEFTRSIINETSDNARAAGASFKELAANSQFSAVEIAKGSRILGQAGFDSFRDIVATLPTVLKLAAVGELDVGAAAEIAAGNMNAFGLTVDKIPNIANSLAKAAVLSQTNIKEMGEALRQVGPIAQQAGVDINDMNAMLAVLATRNIRGSAAGTSLANVIRELTSPSDKGRDALRRLGIDAIDPLSGKMKAAVPLMQEFLSIFSQLTPQSQLLAADQIFNNRAAKGFLTVLAEATSRLPEFQTEIAKAYKEATFLDQIMVKLSETFKFQAKEALNVLQNAFIDAFEGSAGALTDVARAAKDLFASDGFRTGLSNLLTAVAQTTSFLLEHGRAIATVVELYAAWKIAVAAVELGILVLARVSTVISVLRVALVALSSPIGLVVTLVTAAAAAWLAFGSDAETGATKAAVASRRSTEQVIEDIDKVIAKYKERNSLANRNPEIASALDKVDNQIAQMAKDVDEVGKRYQEAASDPLTHSAAQMQSWATAYATAYAQLMGLVKKRQELLALDNPPTVASKPSSGSVVFTLPSKTIGAEKSDILSQVNGEVKAIEQAARYTKEIYDKQRQSLLITEEDFQEKLELLERDKITKLQTVTAIGLSQLVKLEQDASNEIIGLNQKKNRSVEDEAKRDELNANQIRIRTAERDLVERQKQLTAEATHQIALGKVTRDGRLKKLNDEQLGNLYKLKSDSDQRLEKKQQEFDISLMPEYQALQVKEAFEVSEQYYKRIRDINVDIAKAKREDGPGQSTKLASLKAELAITEDLMNSEQQRAAIQLRANYEKAREAKTGIKSALDSYRSSATNDAANYGNAITNIFKQAESAMLNFFNTGKIGFRSFATFIAQELLKIQIAKILAGVATAVSGAFFSAATAASSTGSLYSGPSSVGLRMPNSHTGGIVGIEHGMSMLTLPKFHGGGIVGEEQLIVAKKKEGVFTPAQMRALAPVGSGGGNYIININVTNNGGAVDSSAGGSDPGQFAQGLRVVVVDEIIKQQRPGGALARSR